MKCAQAGLGPQLLDAKERWAMNMVFDISWWEARPWAPTDLPPQSRAAQVPAGLQDAYADAKVRVAQAVSTAAEVASSSTEVARRVGFGGSTDDPTSPIRH